jgi:NTE family protein
MSIGYADAQAQRAEICKFFNWLDPEAVTAPSPLLTIDPRHERRKDPLRLR